MLTLIKSLITASLMFTIPGCDWFLSHPEEVEEIVEDAEDIGKTIIEGPHKPPASPPIAH
jgi:hypothetical protein